MIDRQKKILEYLATEENISVAELSYKLSVSEVTIRSDLNELAQDGKVLRVHGGAQLLEERVRQEYSFQIRKNQNSENKIKIGKYAAQFVNSMDSILFDSSTTVLAMAKALRDRNDVKETTVIPTGIWTAIELMSCANMNVLMPSGYLRNISGSITGQPTSDFFKNLNINKAFLGAWGLSVEHGLTDSHLLEIELKKMIIKKAKEVVILIDGSKFLQNGLSTYSNFKNISKIITDSSAPKNIIKKIRAVGVDVHIVS
ncbi:MAG: DeoR/GlpR transcriptional regulator [Ignavibacteriae bacterium]|nr:DeoR/GlpR transcriptional regulator [Ignavibacteriota bacterium]